MTVRLAGPAALAALLAVTLAACSGTRPAGCADPTVVARWTDETLTLAEFEDAYAATESAITDSTMTTAERRADFLTRYVDFQLSNSF